MPIYGNSLRDAASTFQEHLNSLLSRTITLTPVRPWYVDGEVNGEKKQLAVFGFQHPGGRPGSAELRTKYGPMDLYLARTCDAVQDEESKLLRLRTVSYAYSLQPHTMGDRKVRWEYVKYPGADSRWCRNHVQGPITFDIEDNRATTHSINLNDWHLPTGWVTIEEVIRFCLHDLGARARSDPDEWHQALIASTEVFRTKFADFGEV